MASHAPWPDSRVDMENIGSLMNVYLVQVAFQGTFAFILDRKRFLQLEGNARSQIKGGAVDNQRRVFHGLSDGAREPLKVL